MSAAAAVRVSAGHEREQRCRRWVSLVADGDRDALGALYDATSPLVYSLALRIVANPADAEEVTLDVYLQVWRDARRFDAARGGVMAWLVTLGRSRALDRYRSHERRQKREAPPDEREHPSADPDPEVLLAMSRDRRAVAEALATLPPEQRKLIELAYFQGMSQSEMAEFLSLPLGTVKTRVRQGLIRLRDLLGERE